MKAIFNNNSVFAELKCKALMRANKKEKQKKHVRTKGSLQRKSLLVLTLMFLTFFTGFAQTNNEAEWNGMGYSLKKIVSNTSIPSGVNFSYTIMFSAPAGATSVEIMDALPSSLEYVSTTAAAPVNGVSPNITVSGSPGSQVVNYTLTGLPAGSASSGSFTIVVKFPEGVTCPGTTARNRAGIKVNDWHYTPFVSTTATAEDPWSVGKVIVSGPVANPQGGSCGYLIAPDDTVTYRLYVTKKSPYNGNVTGQLNMTGATVTDVLPAGAVVLSSTCGIPANSTGTITWTPNSGTLDATNSYVFYYCDVTVYYPASSFPIGSTLTNDITLDGTICGQQVSHSSNQTCIEVASITPNPNAYFDKKIYLTNRVPGCTGYYLIQFKNTGNVALSSFNINDVIPSGVAVTQVTVYGGDATTTLALSANSGANVLAPSINTSFFNSGPITTTINDLQLQMTGSMPPNKYIQMQIYFTVEPNPTGTVVENCATFDPLQNSLNLGQQCVSFVVNEGEPHICLTKKICDPQASYEPGDIIRVRLRLQNIGSATFSSGVLQDNLHSNFSYVGNESYYVSSNYNPPCSPGGGIPAGATAWTGVSTQHVNNNLQWTLPDINSNCQLFYAGHCGYYGTFGLDYYFVEFDIKVDSLALPGVTPNQGRVLQMGSTTFGNVFSNTTHTLIAASLGQEVEKEVSTDGGTTYGTSGTTAPGSTLNYRLNYRNTSNVPVTGLSVYDLLPRDDGSNDWLILDRTTTRGSNADVNYSGSHSTTLMPSGTAPSPALSYTSTQNPCIPALGVNTSCSPATWGGTADDNLQIDYGTFALAPNTKIMENFQVNVDAAAKQGNNICNDFAAVANADFLLDGTPQSVSLTPIAAPPVCVQIDTAAATPSCCDSVIIEQSMGAAGNVCCVRIATECEVKAIDVHVTNASFASASWNCGTIPSGYLGQTAFTFNANGCAVSMDNCFKLDGNAPASVTYTIHFQNGESCEKTVDLNCNETSCCDQVKVELSSDPDLADECCTRLVTDCKVDSVAVSITNGTFNMANWACGSMPSDYIGESSYVFDANGCQVDLTTCITAQQAGAVIVNYTVYFANGETCEKKIEFDCPDVISNCCETTTASQSQDATGAPLCCAELNTKCPVDSVQVTVNNGTFSANTWNCTTPIPAAAVGQSNYTFVSGGCSLEMKNCINATQSGAVTVSYLIFFENGEKCEKVVKFDCKAIEPQCCNKTELKVLEPGADGECCTRLITPCEVDSVMVNVTNGTIASQSWNCTSTIPAAAIGQSSYTYSTNGCMVDLKNCFNATGTGSLTATYTVYFSNGEICQKEVKLDCKPSDSSCCAIVDLKLKHKWPHLNTLVGTFTVTNADPSVPICSVSINATPAASFSTGNLIIDGTPSTQSWSGTSIPTSGSLSPAAVNNLVFNLTSTNYKGTVTVCVEKCDGTRCCYDFKWNKKPYTDVVIDIKQQATGKLYAVTVNPVVSSTQDLAIKYVSFGMSDAEEIDADQPEFFAISGSPFDSGDYPEYLTEPMAGYMGKHNAYFELGTPKKAGENLGAFNLVFTKKIPKLGCTLFDVEGNIISSGTFELAVGDTITTSGFEAGAYNTDLFDFIKLYPNPSDGNMNITFATGTRGEVLLQVVNPMGQIVEQKRFSNLEPGLHTKNLRINRSASGLYKVVLINQGKMKSKSAVLK